MEELVSEYDHTQVILVEEAGWGIYSTEETSERFQWYLLDKSDLHTPLVCFDGLNQLFAQSFSSGGDESTGTCHLTTGGSVTVVSNNNEDTEYNAAPVPTTINTTTPDPIILNTEEPVIVDTEETETESPQKWSGLGMMLFNTLGFDNHIDTLLTNGFTEIRMSSDWYSWDLDTSSQSAIISAITKGAQVIWGVQSGGATLTAANCSDYANAVKAAAQWAQDNGIYEFSIGNEEEAHVDGTTLTGTQVITNLKALATEVKEIFTIGNISYSYAWGYIDNWIAEGKGDIDLIAYNLQKGSETKVLLGKQQ